MGISKLYFLIPLGFYLSLNVLAQDKVKIFRGLILDSQTGKGIPNVRLSTDNQRDSAFSGDKGYFKIRAQADQTTILRFQHPHYYDYLLMLKRGSAIHPQYVSMVPLYLHLDTLYYPSFQEIRTVTGEVLRKASRIPIEKAMIIADGLTIGYSNPEGKFEVGTPWAIAKITVSYMGFQSLDVPLGNTDEFDKKIIMVPLILDSTRNFWKDDKNSIRLIANELLTGAVGIDYERFLTLRHSIGLKSSFYFYQGIPYVSLFNAEVANFNGIKVSPYYRAYIFRNNNQGGFFETKFSWGYFDFEELNYYWPSYDMYSEDFEAISVSMGCSAALGWMKRFDYRMLNISFGLQYFPLNVPQTKQSDAAGSLNDFTVDDTFWYWGGPGSWLEIKFMIGGIF
jgi:hypothetical protein